MRLLMPLGLRSVTLLLVSALLTSARVEAQRVGTDAMAGCVACVQCSDNRHALIVGFDDVIGATHACMGPECPGPPSMCGVLQFLDCAGDSTLFTDSFLGRRPRRPPQSTPAPAPRSAPTTPWSQCPGSSGFSACGT